MTLKALNFLLGEDLELNVEESINMEDLESSF